MIDRGKQQRVATQQTWGRGWLSKRVGSGATRTCNWIARRCGGSWASRCWKQPVLRGGLRNTNYKLRLAGEERPAVLRLYTAEAAACAREVALMRLVGERVPVPRVLSADPTADPPWALFEWIDGERFDQMLVQATPDEVEQACRSAGEVLAAIHGFTLRRSRCSRAQHGDSRADGRRVAHRRRSVLCR